MTQAAMNKSIGVFDSGVGGISVLAELIQQLPHERYLYYGDSGNAPYGIKDAETIKNRSLEVVEFLIEQGIKGLVVACNTATSAAIDALREAFPIPIIGMEPALKPAIETNPQGEIVVMATPLTLKEKKFSALMDQFKKDQEIVPLPCPGLVEIIENYGTDGDLVDQYLAERFQKAGIQNPQTIVLGCTHYIFIQGAIHRVMGEQVELIDGNLGTVMQTQRLLANEDLLQREKFVSTQVIMYNSSKDKKLLFIGEMLLKNRLKELQSQRATLIEGRYA